MSNFNREAMIQAVLAEDVYLTKDGKHPHREREIDKATGEFKEFVRVNLPDGSFERLEVIRDIEESADKDGFQAAVYYNKATNTLHGAIRGSETREFAQDWLAADIGGMGLAGWNTQADSAREFMKELLQEAQKIGGRTGCNPQINLTGHSLGGSLAQYLAHYAGDRIQRTDTFNAFGVGDLRWSQKVPVNGNVDNVFNHRMAGDIVSDLSQHYGKVIVYEHPKKDAGSDHASANFTDSGNNGVNVLAHERYNLAYKGEDAVRKEFHLWGKLLRNVKNVVDAPADLIDWGRSKITGVAEAGERATKDGLPPYQASPTQSCIPQGNMSSHSQEQSAIQPKIMPQQPNASPALSDHAELSNRLSPKARVLAAQCEEKLIALCKEKGITADSPQDFKNIAMALADKGLKSGMSRVEKMGMGDNMTIHIMSNEPEVKMASVVANDVVNIPVSQSIEQIQNTERQFAQQAQERQVAQSQQHSQRMIIA